jgi:hypothetical protein
MSQAEETISEAQAFLGDGLELSRLDQIYDLQKLLGPVIAYKVLLGIVINSGDPKEQRLAASKLLDSAGESAERVAERLRASVFRDLSLSDLEAIIQTGHTDLSKAVAEVKPLEEE